MIYVDNAQLEFLKQDIISVTKAWSSKHDFELTVSVGYVIKKEEKLTLRQMAVLADKRMYESKVSYYQNQGIERRRNSLVD